MDFQEYRLKEICEIKSGKRIPKGMDFTTIVTNHPYIRARDIKEGKIQTTDLIYIDEATYGKIKRYIINNGDIAITIAGTVGEVGYAQKEVDGYNLTENAVRLTSYKRYVNGKYLFYLLSQGHYKEYMQNISGGVAQPKLGIYKLERIKVLLPSINIQNQVVRFLSLFDEVIENNKKRIKILEKMAENLYKEWFVRFRFPGYETAEFEDGVPKGWGMKRLSDVATIVMGQSPSSCYYNNDMRGLPFHQGVGSYGNRYLQDDVYSTEGKRIAEANSIIFSVRAPVGRLNITLNKIILGRGVAGINENKGRNLFLYYLLNSKFSKEDLIGGGTIFSSVTKDELYKQKLLMPEDGVCNKFNEMVELIEKEIINIHTQNQNLTKQRDYLLPRLMSGKLEIR